LRKVKTTQEKTHIISLSRIIRYISLLFIFKTNLFSAIINVPIDQNTIQNGINSAENGDTVLVQPGTYIENIDFLGKSIMVSSLFLTTESPEMIDLTIIDGNESGSVVTFNSGENENAILIGFTLENGNGNYADPDQNGSFWNYGGGVYCKNSNPTIIHTIIKDNTGDQGGGGGLFCYNASPTLISTMITGNSTDDVGGGIYARDESSPSLYHVTISENNAEYGGGAYFKDESTPSLDSCIVSGNWSENSGAGIVLKNNANAIISHSWIQNNESSELGGGLYINNASPFITGSTIHNNFANSGAGVYVRAEASPSFDFVTISDNNASQYGEAFYLRGGSTVSITNSIIWYNGDYQVYFRTNEDPNTFNISYSTVELGQQGFVTNFNGDVTWENNNEQDDPLYCNRDDDNYTLRENSPCVGAGENGETIGANPIGCGPINLGPIYYVASNGHDSNDGSMTEPFETIQRAIDACVDGDTVRLNPGEYSEILFFSEKEIVVESRAYEANNPDLMLETIISGASGSRCLSLVGNDANDVTIRGITITGGHADLGGGIFISSSTPTLMDLFVENNSSASGGGLYIEDASPTLQHITFSDNGANKGGAIYLSESDAHLTNIQIENNVAYWGGGIYLNQSHPTIDSSQIAFNQGFIEGGGLYLDQSNPSMSYSIFDQNVGVDAGGALYCQESSPILDHITFFYNESGFGKTAVLANSALTIENSIVWDNDVSQFYFVPQGGLNHLALSYSNIFGGVSSIIANDNGMVTWVDGNLTTSPYFCNPMEGDFHLAGMSPSLTSASDGSFMGALGYGCETALAIENNSFPSTSSIQSIFPNPFNPVTKIQFELERNQNILITIYNINGQSVQEWEPTQYEQGNHSIKWDANSFPSGMYVIRIEGESFSDSRKMVLLK